MEPAAILSQLAGAPAADRTAELLDFEAVIELHWQRIYRFALASLRDADDAQTLAQDCFLKAYRGRAGFRGDAAVQTWLIQIAVNLIRDRARNRRLQFWKRTASGPATLAPELDDVLDTTADPERRILLREQVNAVWSATERLPERQRTAFLLRYVEELDLLQIAAAMGLSEGAVKTHLFRALRTVRGHMKGDA